MNGFEKILPWLLMVGLLGAACGDEPSTANQATANADADGEADADGDGGDVDADADMDADGDGGDVDADGDGEADADADADGEADADQDGDEEEELIFEDVDPVECAHPSDDPDCPQGDYGPASFMSRIKIVSDTTCCEDLNGDGNIDNVLGNLVGMLEGVPGFNDVNGNLQDSIENNQLAYLFEASGLTHPVWTPSFDLFIHEGGATAHSADVNIAGEGSFWLKHWSIIEDTDIRRFGFENAYIYDGELTATGGVFQIRFPGLVEGIDARLENATFRAEVVQDDPAPNLSAGGGFALRNGTLGGAVMRDALFESMNEAAVDCECMGDDVVLYFLDEVADRWQCGLKAEDEANCVDGTYECRALAQTQLCYGLAGVSSQSDLEVNGEKAMSIGLLIETVPTEIEGVLDPE